MTKNSRLPWSKDDERRLRRMWSRVAPLLIAHRLGRSPVAVVEKASQLGLGPNPLTRRKWSEEDRALLRKLWGRRDLLTIARRLGRTPEAVTAMARRQRLGVPWHTFGKTLGELEREHGFKRSKILSAMKKLGMELRPHRSRTDIRFKRKTRQLVRKADIPVLLETLEKAPRIYTDVTGHGRSTKGVWGVGKKPACCTTCGTTERPHYAKGRCQRCYDRRRNKR